jgi:hypothetical protein
MNSSTAAKPVASSPVPLARDPHGNPFAVPAEAAFWRVRRSTRGRPRNVTGLDRGPLRLPLDFTEDDLHNMLGPGQYRLELCDQAGNSLELGATVTVGEPEPADASEHAEPDFAPTLPAATSDVRYLLEANVRAMQLTFAHNERTVAACLRMGETLRDGIGQLASAQAGWITSISSAKGFFRNAPPLQLPAPTEPKGDDEDDEGDDEDDQGDEAADAMAHSATMLETVVGVVAKGAVNAIIDRFTGAGGGFQFGDILNWQRAHDRGQAKREDGGATVPAAPKLETPEAAAAPPPGNVMDVLQQKAMAIAGRLDPAEQLRLVRMLPSLRQHANDPELNELVSKLLPMSTDEAVQWVRSHIDEIEQRFAS